MAFLASGWGLASVDMNSPVQTVGTTVYGSQRIFTYQSSTDAQATIAASGYFNSQAFAISTNDLVYTVGSDSNVWYQLTNTAGVITTTAFSLAGPVGTANLSTGAVTYAKIQTEAATSLLGNPTGGALAPSEITLVSPLGFTGTTLQILPSVLRYATGTITAAQWKALYSAPLQILAATVAGAGKLLVVDKFILNYTYVSAAYAAGGSTLLQYANTVHGGGVAACTALAAAGFSDQTASMVTALPGALAANVATLANTGIFLSCATADFTTGDGTFTYYLTYKIVSVA